MTYQEIINKLLPTLQEMYPELEFKQTQRTAVDFSPPTELIWVRYYELSDDGRDGPRQWDLERWENILLHSTNCHADLDIMVQNELIVDVFGTLIESANQTMEMFFEYARCIEEGPKFKKYNFVKKDLTETTK